MVYAENNGFRSVTTVFGNIHRYRSGNDSYNCGYCPISRVFTNSYGYRAVTLVIVNNYGYRTNIYSYWSITIGIGLIVQTACHGMYAI
jgi:hypothetical protein